MKPGKFTTTLADTRNTSVLLKDKINELDMMIKKNTRDMYKIIGARQSRKR